MLRIPQAALDEIQAHMEATYPHECCGLIIGALEGAARVAATSRRCRNLNTERAQDRYELDPKDMLAAQQELDGGPWDIIGIYHSHPDHPSRPSQTDLNHAWPGWSYMIGSVATGSVENIQSWELNSSGERFDEESMEIQPVEREEN
jgi:proteasome lid subunit RPN8/RPN11